MFTNVHTGVYSQKYRKESYIVCFMILFSNNYNNLAEHN